MVRNKQMLARNGDSLTNPLLAQKILPELCVHSRCTKAHPYNVSGNQPTEIIYREKGLFIELL